MELFKMSVKYGFEDGFTLVELLVALLVASFLLIILFDGLANASERSARQLVQQRALTLAQEKLISTVRVSSGVTDNLTWEIEEEIIASNPRDKRALVKRIVTISDKNTLRLINLEKRYLRSNQ